MNPTSARPKDDQVAYRSRCALLSPLGDWRFAVFKKTADIAERSGEL
jgi:hypothetical protein